MPARRIGFPTRIILSLFLFLAFCEFTSKCSAQEYVPGEVLIRFKPTSIPSAITRDSSGNIITGFASIDSLNRKWQISDFKRIHQGRLPSSSLLYELKFADSLNVDSVVSTFGLDQNIAIANPNHILYLFTSPVDKASVNRMPFVTIPNDSLFIQQWAFEYMRMNNRDAWDFTPYWSNVVIEIIDRGVDWYHEDLEDNMWINTMEDINQNGRFDSLPAALGGDSNGVDEDGNGYADDVVGWDFIGNNYYSTGIPNPDYNPENSLDDISNTLFHGDWVAGTAAAVTNNIVGIAGTTFNRAKIMAARIGFVCNGCDSTITEGFALQAIQYGMETGAEIINMSWGYYGPLPLLESVLNEAYDSGIVLVAASGNRNWENPPSPARFDKVIAVTGTDRDGLKCPNSNYGTYIDICAPCENWVPSLIFDKVLPIDPPQPVYEYTGGTSISSPFVAGVAALLKASVRQSLTNVQIKEVLLNSADSINQPGYIGKLGSGEVNAFKAVYAVSRGDVTNDGRWSPSDVVYMINYIYHHGPLPQPQVGNGDCNCDGLVGVSDLNWLINYYFKGGPEPLICYRYTYTGY